MKVILLKDVPRVGRKNEVKEVAPGFARTMLLSRSLAVVATPQALQELKKRQSAAVGEKAVEHELADKAAGSLAGFTVTMRGRASEEGNLFAALHAEDVAAAIRRDLNLELDPGAIILSEPLKKLGLHQAKARFSERAVAFNILLENQA